MCLVESCSILCLKRCASLQSGNFAEHSAIAVGFHCGIDRPLSICARHRRQETVTEGTLGGEPRLEAFGSGVWTCLRTVGRTSWLASVLGQKRRLADFGRRDLRAIRSRVALAFVTLASDTKLRVGNLLFFAFDGASVLANEHLRWRCSGSLHGSTCVLTNSIMLKSALDLMG